MDKPETRLTSGTRHRAKTNKAKKTTTQKNKNMSNTDPTKKTTLNKTKQTKTNTALFIYLNGNMFDFWLN
jgi:hypothetical protein